MKSLADFKRALAVPGATVFVTRNDFLPDTPEFAERRARMFAGRKVARLQTNAVKFDDGAWLYFGKAVEWSFPDGVPTLNVHRSGKLIAYRFE